MCISRTISVNKEPNSYTVKMNEYKQPFFSYLSYIFVTQVTLKWVVFTLSLLINILRGSHLANLLNLGYGGEFHASTIIILLWPLF